MVLGAKIHQTSVAEFVLSLQSVAIKFFQENYAEAVKFYHRGDAVAVKYYHHGDAEAVKSTPRRRGGGEKHAKATLRR